MRKVGHARVRGKKRGYKATHVTDPVLEWTGDAPPAAAPKMDRRARRAKVRRERKVEKRIVRQKVGVADIPPGSVLSDQTIKDIAAGNYSLAQTQPPRIINTPRRLTYHELCLARHRAKKRHVVAVA